MADEFMFHQFLGKKVHRYGISTSNNLDEAGVREAIDLGANYLFWNTRKKFLNASNPSIDVVISAPKTAAEMRENMQALQRGPLSPDEMAQIRALGKAVHG